MYYGLTNQQQALEMARQVCDVIGHGGNGTAVELLVETAAQETHLGAAKDLTIYGAGHGLCQFDHIGFVDVQQRTKRRLKAKVFDAFRVDIDKVMHRELEYAPLLSMIFCRLKYVLVPSAIPADLEGRAHYWKKYYNSSLGKGKPEEYVRNAHRIAIPAMKGGECEKA